jgi:hypothetical protein
MAIHRLSQNALLKGDFNVAITAAATNGTAVDTQGYREATAIFYSVPSGTGTTSDCKLQESVDSTSGDFVDVTSATFTQAITANGAQYQFMDIDLSKRLRWLRLVHTGAGGSAAGVASGAFLLFRPWNAAPTQDTAAVLV